MAKKQNDVVYMDERQDIVNNLKYTLKRGGERAASQKAKIYGTIGDNGKITGNITLNKNKARRAAKDGEIYGRLEHADVQKYLGKGSEAEKTLLAQLKQDKPQYTTGQAYGDDIAEIKEGVSDIHLSPKSTLEMSVRKTNPARKK